MEAVDLTSPSAALPHESPREWFREWMPLLADTDEAPIALEVLIVPVLEDLDHDLVSEWERDGERECLLAPDELQPAISLDEFVDTDRDGAAAMLITETVGAGDKWRRWWIEVVLPWAIVGERRLSAPDCSLSFSFSFSLPFHGFFWPSNVGVSALRTETAD